MTQGCRSSSSSAVGIVSGGRVMVGERKKEEERLNIVRNGSHVRRKRLRMCANVRVREKMRNRGEKVREGEARGERKKCEASDHERV